MLTNPISTPSPSRYARHLPRCAEKGFEPTALLLMVHPPALNLH